jgi:thioredoxin-dependent peroxiredoxin
VSIVGVSYGKPAAAAKWVEKEGFGYEIWSDDDRTLADTYGASGMPVPKRITMLLDADGAVKLAYTAHIQVGAHPDEVLQDATRLFGPGKK